MIQPRWSTAGARSQSIGVKADHRVVGQPAAPLLEEVQPLDKPRLIYGCLLIRTQRRQHAVRHESGLRQPAVDMEVVRQPVRRRDVWQQVHEEHGGESAVRTVEPGCLAEVLEFHEAWSRLSRISQSIAIHGRTWRRTVRLNHQGGCVQVEPVLKLLGRRLEQVQGRLAGERTNGRSACRAALARRAAFPRPVLPTTSAGSSGATACRWPPAGPTSTPLGTHHGVPQPDVPVGPRGGQPFVAAGKTDARKSVAVAGQVARGGPRIESQVMRVSPVSLPRASRVPSQENVRQRMAS